MTKTREIAKEHGISEKIADEVDAENKAAGVGHNSGEVSGARIKAFVERVERLEEEKKAISEDVRDVYSEAKAQGFDAKILRKLVSIRKVNLEKRREEQELLQLYASAMQLELGF